MTLKVIPTIVTAAITKVQTTPVYDLYWRFAAERQAIFFGRLQGKQAPWTSDPIFQRYKFTNVYRASDRVSQFLIRHVIYNNDYPGTASEIVFRVLLFKLFNKISTWCLLESQIGPLHWQSFDIDAYDRVLTNAAASGLRLYSPAYIMPPVSLDTTKIKHRGHLRLIDMILRSNFIGLLQQTTGLHEVFELLKRFPSLGNFLAFQLAIDINYSAVINHDEAGFVVAGPGARDGLAKTFVDVGHTSAEALIAFMMDQQEAEFDRLGLSFDSLWGRRLQLIDCQNLFCEISKYTRVSHPDIAGLSGRTRIKQMFRPQPGMIQPWYPPKWGLNEKIPNYAVSRDYDLFTVPHEVF